MSEAARVRTLVDELGPTLTAAMAGARSRQLVHDWAAGVDRPDSDASVRLEVAFFAWTRLVATEEPDVVRNWFVGANPWLGGEAPAIRIREGSFRAVAAAVEAMRNDQGGA